MRWPPQLRSPVINMITPATDVRIRTDKTSSSIVQANVLRSSKDSTGIRRRFVWANSLTGTTAQRSPFPFMTRVPTNSRAVCRPQASGESQHGSCEMALVIDVVHQRWRYRHWNADPFRIRCIDFVDDEAVDKPQ